jgi:beta-glucosidase
MRIGARPAVNEDTTIENAVQLARESDRAVLIVGLNSDWESEGFDRPNLALPGR